MVTCLINQLFNAQYFFFVADKSSGLGKLTSSTKRLTQHCWSKMQSLGEIVCLLFASNQICLLRFSNLLVMVALKKKKKKDLLVLLV